jgi:hypothetical protein
VELRTARCMPASLFLCLPTHSMVLLFSHACGMHASSLSVSVSVFFSFYHLAAWTLLHACTWLHGHLCHDFLLFLFDLEHMQLI